MKVQHNISLQAYNTFGIDVLAREFIEINSVASLQQLVAKRKEFFVLSGGSNVLLTRNFEGLVVYLNTKGIEVVFENQTHVEVQVQAGENWHDFVLWCLDKDYGGLENLSLIPGNVGTSPIQNIGAYGVEVKDLITQVTVLDIASNELHTFSNAQCQFGYRNSVFKNDLKGTHIVTAVTFRLTKKSHQLNTSYGAIETALQQMGVATPTISDISKAVIAIRSAKLPDPKQIGNSGSFFKNPVIPMAQFEELIKLYPNMPSYPVSKALIKVPAGWLIEQAGFKGKRLGDAGVHEKQALVLVNYGNAKGDEIYQLALTIQKEIARKYGIALEMEVNVI